MDNALKDIKQIIASPSLTAQTDVCEQVLTRIESTQASGVTPDEQGLTILVANFALYRSGEFRLWYDAGDLPERSRIRSETAENPQFAFDDFREQLTNQFYFFVKEICHRHYHHHSSSDELLPIIASHRFDDFSWRRETIYALARAVLQTRRRDSILDHRSAEGIMAYADAFQANLGGVIRRPSHYLEHEDNKYRPHYDWRHLKQSSSAKLEEQNWRYNARIQLYGFLLTTLLTVLAIWLAVQHAARELRIRPGKTEEYKSFVDLSHYASDHPWSLAILSALVAAFLFEFAGRGFRSFGALVVIAKTFKKPIYAAAVELSAWLRRYSPDYAFEVAANVASLVTAILAGALIYLVVRMMGL